eukprot:CAMPEP_0180421814 /NCGR_PEP_ID=MMETSP1036_2-20121128/3350_1 /TAXON_ID=632150 /ORGANISM="Azadinium spinosum, Strain 3D9" /LENGTH=120 /DNA_ID=CAMNT_0022427101 /DNA_START=188 /DNA_END=548 /DNA_ORIENTATION=+
MTLTNWDAIANVLSGVVNRTLVIACFAFYIMVTSYTMKALFTGIITDSLVNSQQEYRRRKLTKMEQRKDEVDDMGCVDQEDLKTSLRGDTELLTKLAETGTKIDETRLLEFIEHMSGDGK